MPISVVRPSSLTAQTPSSTDARFYCARHSAMATEYSLYLYADSYGQADSIASPVFEEIDRIENLLSNYRGGSELSRINREAAAGEVTTDPETFRFLETCLAWSARSQGAFDITVGKLMKAWGFFGAKGVVPSKKELALARDRTGWQKVQLDSARRTVRFLSPGIELDPGGIGKGYAIDRAVKLLRARGVSSALLSAGSSTIYALGAPPDKPGWRIRVPAPHRQEIILSTVTLRDTSLSTANRSEKHFIDKGHLYGAIMDPRTLRPVKGVQQATAISPSATDSDALSNALFILKPQDRSHLLDQLPHVSALVIAGDRHAATYETTRWPAAVVGEHRTESADTEENGKI